ncbi:hypothetical protein M427DRAFT_74808 [Gonapodya prolifera JEL478]|uniref:Prolyl endopeptidase-like n=1 Tax=Gonapodya prolifera (strain JEL478) TaxID=1344416 RepID=A0A138ZZG0_GONPJ|nr:hypothetical protein M427DRAFT_74808 [Gonapodya prolifera JEL478]|eukprot:KXS09897.1 hypothetical protein M427DRAFT_74808 [Gonapodya prolifera JEL478]
MSNVESEHIEWPSVANGVGASGSLPGTPGAAAAAIAHRQGTAEVYRPNSPSQVRRATVTHSAHTHPLFHSLSRSNSHSLPSLPLSLSDDTPTPGLSSPLPPPLVSPQHQSLALPLDPILSAQSAESLLKSHFPTVSAAIPSISDLPALDAYIESSPTNLVQLLPDIFGAIERFVLDDPDQCSATWAALRPLVADYTSRLAHLTTVVHSPPTRPPSPVCPPRRTTWTNAHGDEWHDDYAHLTDREDPSVIAHIGAENAYARAVMKPAEPLQKLLYKEFVSRIDETEATPRVQLGDGFWYSSRKVPGAEYRVHCRARDAQGTGEEVYLDENALAESDEFANAAYFRLGFLRHSPDGKLVAFGVDTTGSERYTTLFVSLEPSPTSDTPTFSILPHRIPDVYEHFEFSADGKWAYYTLLDGYERSERLMRWKIGTPISTATLLHHEPDDKFYVTLTKTASSAYFLVSVTAQVTSEILYLSAHDTTDTPHVLFPKTEGVQVSVEHHGGHFYTLSNREGAKNNWIYRVPVPTLHEDGVDWTEEELMSKAQTVIAEREFVLIEDMQVRHSHLVVFERSNCLQNVRIVYLGDSDACRARALSANPPAPDFSTYHYISFSDPVYSVFPSSVDEEVADLSKQSLWGTTTLRFQYSSFVQPKQVLDYDMERREVVVVHEEGVGGKMYPYDRTLYSSRRLFAISQDGTPIPVSLVYRRDLLGMNMTPPQPNPCLLHSYGAYGGSTNPIFSPHRLSLLDRGFVYAIAHVRGGAEMGSAWYEGGKLGEKMNTFWDFTAVAEYLCKEGWTSPQRLAIYGRSAGGLLIGASVNLRPELFKVALTEVPFVDVVNTMFDSTIPWTAFEYEEWGNPSDKAIYDAMKSYCPYTNLNGEKLARNQYPNMLVIGGMNDPRVAFFEPLKYVSKMRNERRKAREEIRTRWVEEKKAQRRRRRGGGGRGDHEGSTPDSDATKHDGRVLSGGGGPYESILENHGVMPAVDYDGDTESEGESEAEDKDPVPDDAELFGSEERLTLLLLDDVGHGGNSGVYSYLEDLSFEYSFIISCLEAPFKPILQPGATNAAVTATATASGGQSFDAVLASAPGTPAVASLFARPGASVGVPYLQSPTRLVGAAKDGYDPESSDDEGGVSRKRAKAAGGPFEDVYRTGGKKRGDRAQNKLYQWFATWF